MTNDGDLRSTRLRGPARLTWRRSREATRVSVLSLGLVTVFLLSLGHDEIVAALVSDGMLAAGAAERAEIILGLVLFLVWGALTVRLVDIFRHSTTRPTPSDREQKE
jgi:hypothetical protein